ncbi:MAG: IS110 family transposase [Desulfobacterales bacterium]|nr:IS110 family transposase [Desulfobacterales bacterium]
MPWLALEYYDIIGFKIIQSVIGIKDNSTASVIAEIRVDMSRFLDEAHAASWARVCPVNNESAGKKKSGNLMCNYFELKLPKDG